LTEARENRPLQSDLRRAISTAYYALFHCLAKCCADLLVGTVSANRSDEAWTQVYRALMHGETKNACLNDRIIAQFPQEIQDFANHFVTMQIKRHEADYHPEGKHYKSDVQTDIAAAEAVIRDFAAVSIKDRRAFAVWVLFKPPRRS
jgi:uncharacterized protein (UPF0332 family)